MSHLTLEELARLLDEAPAAQEAAHLGTCELCRAELEQLREDQQSLSLLPDVAPAPDAWAALEHRLVAEGLIRRRGFAPASTRMLQIAAALVLFLGGTIAGRMSVQVGETTLAQLPPPATSAPADAEATRGVPVPPAPETALAAGADAPATDDNTAGTPRTQPHRSPNVALASNNFTLGPQVNTQVNTMEDAITVLRQAEELYLAALTRYAELATQAEDGDPIARLAALTSIVMTTQAALSQTPMDPVINGYHLTALAQRDATLRQVAAATGDRVY
jgi:hypothetical protein